MKVIVAGSREGIWPFRVKQAIHEAPFNITEIVSGTANGVDKEGEGWAYEHGVPLKKFKPDWGVGRHAGFLRNKEMAEYADALIAVWDGKSKGTEHMIKTMEALGKPVYVLNVNET